ncbi:MAG: hypothetical protein VXW15_15170 [Bdellovibrionota bacterium]|nr:hypothetical protein [Bdellovibrionota bacterium]
MLLEIKPLRQYSLTMMAKLKKLYLDGLISLNVKKGLIYAFFLFLSMFSFNAKADVDFMIRGGLLSGLWSIDVNTDAYTSTRRGNIGGATAAASLSLEGSFFSIGLEYEQSIEERWYYGDASETSDDNNWDSMSANKKKYIAFLGLGTTGQNMFSFISTRIGYVKANLDLGNNILANNPKASYEGNGVKLSFFYKNIFQTLDWGIDLSLDLNYILYDSLSSNGLTTKLPGTIGNYTYSKLQELSGSLMLGISFTFLKNILEMQPGGEFFKMPGDS